LTCGHAPLPPFRKPRRLTLDRTAAVTQTSASLSTFLPGRGGGAAAPRRGWAQICRDSSRPGADAAEQDRESKNDLATATVPKIGGGGGGGGGGGQLSDWITSVLLFGIWAGLMYYVLQLAPNQTPVCTYRDTYFLQKLLNLKVDDGFRMNNVLVSLWYIMGIWPLVYSMLLLPTGRRLVVELWRTCHEAIKSLYLCHSNLLLQFKKQDSSLAIPGAFMHWRSICVDSLLCSVETSSTCH
uniref:Uncharacterized protein n=1 Tax=Aegilops tauschii subsp. strangulata TaxID=200361 RepID=A0A453NEC7_AEGTS